MEQEYNKAAAATSTAYENAPQTEPTAPRPQKVRRVGTVALGLTLIVGGILMVLHIVVPALQLYNIVRFAPVLLIVLGIEVLIYAAAPDVKIKYDFLSMFLCFVLICGVGCASVVGELWNYYGPEQRLAYAQREDSMNAQAAAALQAVTGMPEAIRDMSVQIDDYSFSTGSTTAAENCDARLYVTMQRDIFPDAAAYALGCRRIMDACTAAGLEFAAYEFDTWYSDDASDMVTYDLDADSPWLISSSAEALTTQVRTRYWYDGSSFDTAEECAAYRADALGIATAENAAM